MENKPRVAVISPFLDKRHGTERCVAEQVERLSPKYEIHLYCARVEDVNLNDLTWHRISTLPGPHLLGFCWWFLANHLRRWWDAKFRGLRFDLTYTPGINCFDADFISVHVLFSDFYRQVRDTLSFRHNPASSWLRLMHRRLYYRLIIGLEKLIYTRKKTLLTAVSRRTADNLSRFGGREIPVIYHGISLEKFNFQDCRHLRDQSRGQLGLSGSTLCLLLVGNGWKSKGLDALLAALGSIGSGDWRLLVVGQDDPQPHRKTIANLGLEERVSFLPPRPDVEFFYAAADVYVSPSLEDAFGLPPLEAMGCGLPVIVSSRAGVSELITDGVDGIVLKDPRDVVSLAQVISDLHANPVWRDALGKNAAQTALQHTWERNAAELDALFAQVLAGPGSQGPFDKANEAVR
jgi:UDP-glucose:(heptosyl)LPS alpha-1,3-glucosyltransferase